MLSADCQALFILFSRFSGNAACELLARFVSISIPLAGMEIIVLIPSSRDQAALIRAAFQF